MRIQALSTKQLLVASFIGFSSLTISFVSAQEQSGAGSGEIVPTLFETMCAKNNVPTKDRYRVCEKMIASTGPYSSSVMFLRSRVNDLMNGMDANAQRASTRFHWWSTATVVVVFVAAFLGLLVNAFASRLQSMLLVIIAVSPLIVASFGWKEQLRAELSARMNLSTLRDRIDTAVAAAAGGDAKIDDKLLAAWLNRYDEIMRTHAETYSTSFKLLSAAPLFGPAKVLPGGVDATSAAMPSVGGSH